MGRILIVDDHVETAVLVGQTLGFSGHRVDCLTKPGRGATWEGAFLRKVSEGIGGEAFDVVLLDTQLHPKGDGRDLARALAERPGSRPKIILSSGMARPPEGVRELLRLGVIHDFLAKPFGIDSLLEVIAKVLATPIPAPISDADPAHQ